MVSRNGSSKTGLAFSEPNLYPIEHSWLCNIDYVVNQIDHLHCHFSSDSRLEVNSYGHQSKTGRKSLQIYAGCHRCKKGTDIIFIYPSRLYESVPLGVPGYFRPDREEHCKRRNTAITPSFYSLLLQILNNFQITK
ncbi:hypothetical protein TNCV_2264981 [Trichonephila clavipes]|nr:hypothetical protein TNCV_2264981 [Trichonephila clavipes]